MNDGLKYPEQALLPGLHAAPRGLAGDGPEADLPPETDAARASGPYDDQHLLPGSPWWLCWTWTKRTRLPPCSR